VLAENSGHNVQTDAPDLIVWAIKMALEAARGRALFPSQR
jgi:hypothetical protein